MKKLITIIVLLVICSGCGGGYDWSGFTYQQPYQVQPGPQLQPVGGMKNQDKTSTYWQEKRAKQEYNRDYYKNLGIDYPYDW